MNACLHLDPAASREPTRNDVHSQLNPTAHRRVLLPRSAEQVAEAVAAAHREGLPLAIAGAQHAMGGQQFAADGWLLDSRQMNAVHDFDSDRGVVSVGAGMRWPQLQAFLVGRRATDGSGWGIRQKQTGADDFSLGGALASNIHGRGLNSGPLVEDIESFTLVTADGSIRRVDREVDPTLFALVIGGYGLFGVVTDVQLRLARRRALERRVSLLRRADLAAAFSQSRRDGALYGDFQFAIDPACDDFLDLGVFACYWPINAALPTRAPHPKLGATDWAEMLWLAHVDKSRAFRRYSDFYLATHGQQYCSDDHQFGVYLDGYHAAIDQRLGHRGSEVITELYVPLAAIDRFLAGAAELARQQAMDIIYGTVRVIRQDTETVLAWARQDWACVVLNLHVRHDAVGQQRAAGQLQSLIDCALAFGGSFYLTYHRHVRGDQLRTAYPRIDEFIAAKRQHDPRQLFCSDWYRWLQSTLAAPPQQPSDGIIQSRRCLA